MHIFFVPHTHWDREWYYPLEVFRRYLEEMMGCLIDLLEHDREFGPFVLDGQMVPLEDYLEWHPEKRDAIEALARQKRLRIGPWYTQPDEFIPGGESLVRNLLMGKAWGRDFGDWMAIGYVPDSFGHTGQLPQILKGFGIDHAVFSRGIGDEPRSSEYMWESPDGSAVLATCQLHAYSNAGHLPRDGAEGARRVSQEIEKITPYLATQFGLLNQGGDHQLPQEFLPRLIRELRESGAYESVTAGDYEGYSRLVKKQSLKKVPRLAGALRGSRYYPVLCGVLSARRDLKLRNEQAERLLLRWVEPIGAIAGLVRPTAFATPLRRAWRLLLQNHAHDTACGCCVDEVAREAAVRFDKVEQIGGRLKKEALEHLAGALFIPAPENREASTYLVVNPLGFTRSDPVRLRVVEPAEAPARDYALTDARGVKIPCQTLEVREREGSFPAPSRTRLRETALVFIAENVAPLGTAVYHLAKDEPHPRQQEAAGEPVIANDFYRVSLEEDGTLTIGDLRSGKTYPGLCLLEDEADSGDTYNFSPVPGEERLRGGLSDVTREVLEPGPVQKTLRLRGTLTLPEALAESRRERSAARVQCPVVMQVSIFNGVPRVDVVLQVENLAKDHRLRAVFPLGEECAAARTDEAFDVQRIPSVPTGKDWIEAPCGVWPMGSFVDLTGHDRALTVIASGVREAEIRRGEKGGEAALTLLRAVGWLSREDNFYRRVEAGPKIPTPDAQMKGAHTFHLALWPHLPGEHPLASHQTQAHGTPLEAIPVTPHGGSLPSGAALLSYEPQELIMSALKAGERDDSVVLRLFNPTDEPLAATLKTALPLRGRRVTNMAEEAHCDEEALDAPIPVKAHEIVTIALVPEDGNNSPFKGGQ